MAEESSTSEQVVEDLKEVEIDQKQSSSQDKVANGDHSEMDTVQEEPETSAVNEAPKGQGSVTADEPEKKEGIVQAPVKKRKLTMDEGEDGNLFVRLSQDVVKANERLMEYLVEKTLIITDIEMGRTVIDEMMASSLAVSVDCEGVNLGDRRSGKVTLVQVGDMNQRAFLFDVQEQSELSKELKRLLESESIVKVMHDCRADSEGLYSQFGIHMRNVFDTQSAHVVIQKGNGKYTNADKNISLDQVCVDYGGTSNSFKDKVKGVYRKDQRFWSRRPLTSLMTSYAASDVLCLLPNVYEELNRQISSEDDKKLLAELTNRQITETRNKHSSKGSHSRHNYYRSQPQYYPSRRGRGRGSYY